ncbi:MAG: M56 family metallopeptidase [Oscillospiraceae bacterium]|nr:M56 family metallopeptidase [Oscillospiraceae bacterium]
MLTDIFKTVLAMSIAGGMLGLVLMALRPVTSRLFGPNWQYRLWLAALIVMIVPISFRLPEAPSRPADISPAPTTVTQTTAPTVPDTPGTPEHILPTATNDHMMIVIGMPTLPTFPFMPYNAADIAARLWLIGAVLALVIRILLYLSFINSFRKAEAAYIEYPKLKSITIKKTELDSPLVVGLFRPTLLLPENISEEYLGYVLRHEAVHLRRRDLLVKWFAMLVKCVHWFNPMVYMISRKLDEDCEISCDAEAALGLDSDGRDSYMRTILNLLEGSRRRAKPLTTAMTGGARLIRRRFSAIRRLKKINPALRLISIPLALILLGAAMFCGGALAGELRYSQSFTPETENDFSVQTPRLSMGERYVYLPMDMKYNDPEASYHNYHFRKGLHILSKWQIEEIMKFRFHGDSTRPQIIDVPEGTPLRTYMDAVVTEMSSETPGIALSKFAIVTVDTPLNSPHGIVSENGNYSYSPLSNDYILHAGDVVLVLREENSECFVVREASYGEFEGSVYGSIGRYDLAYASETGGIYVACDYTYLRSVDLAGNTTFELELDEGTHFLSEHNAKQVLCAALAEEEFEARIVDTPNVFSLPSANGLDGRIYVYVPMRTVYNDTLKGIDIDIQPGVNLLTKKEAELVLNYRYYSEDKKAYVINVPDDMPIKAVNVSYPTATIIKGVSINIGYSIPTLTRDQISVEETYIKDTGHLFFPGDTVTVLADDGEKCIVNPDGTNFYAYIDKSCLLYGLWPDVPAENNNTWAESMLGG